MHDLYIQKFGDGFFFSEEIKQRVIALKAEFQDLQLYFEKDPEVCVFSLFYTTILWNMWIPLFHLHSQIHVVSNWWSLDHNPMLLD